MLTTDTPDPIASCRALARLDHLVMTHLDSEVLVYDLTTNAIHHLNPTSHGVWPLCDGRRTVYGIARAASAALGADVPLEAVVLALGQLAAANLLVGASPAETREPRHSRRPCTANVDARDWRCPYSSHLPHAAQTSSCKANGVSPCTGPDMCCSRQCLSNTYGEIPHPAPHYPTVYGTLRTGVFQRCLLCQLWRCRIQNVHATAQWPRWHDRPLPVRPHHHWGPVNPAARSRAGRHTPLEISAVAGHAATS